MCWCVKQIITRSNNVTKNNVWIYPSQYKDLPAIFITWGHFYANGWGDKSLNIGTRNKTIVSTMFGGQDMWNAYCIEVLAIGMWK